LLASIVPGELQKSIRATGGTEAVEAAMQIAMLYTGRRKFLSVEGSYHGNSIGTLSIGSSENREQFKNLLPNCIKIKPPLDNNAADKVETRLKNKGHCSADNGAGYLQPGCNDTGSCIYEKDKCFVPTLRNAAGNR
jgi:4-aminobutyrate aminotransferase-like enzyme